MDYRTFVENMKEQVQANLGQDYEVQIITNPKLNGTEKTGLSISRTQEPPQVVPVLYLEECFERYLQDGGFATREDVRHCLARYCLQEECMDQKVSKLSGGEKNMLQIALLAASDAQLLILDEPTNHLDIKYQLQLMDIVKSLDITIIAAIHDLNIAAMYCDYIYVMKHGEIVTKGTPKEVLTSEIIEEIYPDLKE